MKSTGYFMFQYEYNPIGRLRKLLPVNFLLTKIKSISLFFYIFQWHETQRKVFSLSQILSLFV